MSRVSKNSPEMIERVVSALSYITLGTVGFIFMLIAFFNRTNIKPFLRYHIFQSIFLSIAYFLIYNLLGFAVNLFSLIPFVGGLLLQLTIYLNMPLLFGFSLIEFVITLFLFYLAWTSFFGQMSYIPWVSDVIKANVRE